MHTSADHQPSNASSDPASWPVDACIHELFERQAARAPQATAIVCEGVEVSYRELNARANRLAHFLLAQDVGPDVPVGLCLRRGMDMIVAILAVLKAGGAYVPVDPVYPSERKSHMLDDCGAGILLTESALLSSLPATDARIVCVDRDAACWEAAPADNPAAKVQPRDLAYVIYTSGSTGKPKGVQIEHRSLVSYITGHVDRHAIGAQDRLLQFASVSFDAAAEEIYGALVSGATLVLRTEAMLLEPAGFVEQVAQAGITILDLPTAYWHQLTAALCATGAALPVALRLVVIGGEAALPHLVAQWLARWGGGITLANTYGPTETTIVATSFTFPAGWAEDSAPIGTPVGDTQAYVLDAQGSPVPDGATGELYLGGAQLARGYLNRPELTAERFVPNPFGQPGGRLYRTGDLVRRRADGQLEYVGRIDTQVKIRGFRVELGEIDNALLRHADVREAVTVAREDSGGDKRLVAYVVAHDRRQLAPQALRDHLRLDLPDYMLPSAFVVLDALPLTSNGKIDRKALPEPGADAYAAGPYEAPAGATEEALACLWGELLRIERVGRHDNFFELGGHSLLAVTLVERVRKLGFGIDVRTLFEAPTIAALAQAAHHAPTGAAVPPNLIPPGCTEITPGMLPLVELSPAEIGLVAARVPGGAANIQDIYPLAPLQQGMLFHHQMAKQGDLYLDSSVVRFDDRARLDEFAAALQKVVDRHDILRTAIVADGLAEPVQVVLRHAGIALQELAFDPRDGDIAAQLKARFNRSGYRLDLGQAPMMRLFAARDPQRGDWLLLTLLHHLVGDHTTEELMHEEIALILEGRDDALPQPQPFRNFVAQTLLGTSHAEHEAFFRNMLADVDEPTLPFGLRDVRGDGSGIAEARQELEPMLAQRMRACARQLGVTPASLVHLAWAQVAGVTAGRNDVVFGTVLFGRMQGGEGADRALGLFINTLPVRVALGDADAAACVRKLHQDLAALLRHEHAPLALAQRCSSVPPPLPLFSSLLNYRYASTPAASMSDASRRAWQSIGGLSEAERTNYPLTLSVDDMGDGFRLVAQVVEEIGPRRVCALMCTALEKLVGALEHKAPLPRDILPAGERARLLALAPAVPLREQPCLHKLVEATIARMPARIALSCGDERLSYAELDQRANRLAHHLQAQGVGPDVLVGVFAERGIGLVIGLLAILKAGGAYVPVDPGSPRERVEFILADADVRVLLTQRSLLDQLGDNHAPRVLLDERQAWGHFPSTAPACAATPSNLAYVIYTSGSTGKPKGVLIEHRNVTRLFAATDAWFGFNENDVWSVFHSFAFDFSVWELWGPLLTGGRAVIVPYLASRSATEFLELLRRERVTVLNQTPSAFLQLDQAEQADPQGTPLALRYVIFGGEALEPLALKPWFARHGEGGPELINMYGITETTVHVTWHRIDPAALDQGRSVIGRAIPDLSLYVLDGNGNPAPVGVTGELHVGGAGLARGYLNRPELTAARFIPDPFAHDPQGRLYRSGDLARWLPDGTLEYLGRIDAQVKIRGFRIELGEIENALLRHAALREAVVLAREDRPGDKRLVAYLTSHPDHVAAPSALREHLRESLPEYMVPSAFIVLDALPLTGNGKVDRRALPAPVYEGDQAAYIAPRTPLEVALAAIVADVLGIERAGMADSFFELGGHSLLATQLVSRVRRELDAELTLAQVFATPALGDLAGAIEAATRASYQAIRPAPRNRALPASFEQERLWFLDRFHAQQEGLARASYLIPLALQLEGNLDHACLQRALHALIERHETLRTAFVLEEGQLVQAIDPECAIELPLTDLRSSPERLRQWLDEQAVQGFDLSTAPLLRAALARLGADMHVLLVNLHHSISDAWSNAILARELGALYEALLHGKDAPLPPLPIQYADYAAWQRSEEAGSIFEHQLEYWTRQLADLPPLLDLPTDRPRPAQTSFAGAQHTTRLPASLGQALGRIARERGATLFMTLTAAFAVLLGRYARQADIALGTPVANRSRSELEGLIGFFVNTLVLRIDLERSATFDALLDQVRQTCLDAYAHQELPFEHLVSALNPERGLAYNPLFQVMITLQNAAGDVLRLPGVTATPVEPNLPVSKFDLTLSMRELADGAIECMFEYGTDLFDRTTIERMAGHFENLLEAVALDSARPLAGVVLLGEAERRLLTTAFNATPARQAGETPLHRLFEAQVRLHPDAVALEFVGARLTYTELNARANRLARRLSAQGIVPGDLVGLCVEPGFDMVACLLAVLKAGAAYLPIDPAYPPARIAYMASDAGLAAVLTQADVAGRVELPAGVRVLLSADPLEHSMADDDLEIPVGGEDLAYLIYTSGSTGRPKGVEVLQRGLSSMAQEHAARLECGPGCRVLQFVSFSFDVATCDIALALCSGATLVLAPRAALAPGSDLNQALRTHAITHVQLPASVMTVTPATDLPALRVAVAGGEACAAPVIAQWCNGRRLVNAYGPTETTVCVTMAELGADRPITIGRPLANTQVYVLDQAGQPVPLGVPGELHIGGIQVARGYRNQPELTAQRFIADPFSTTPGGRMYKSGDLARWRPDGTLEYLGRVDQQVKIRGFRIELGEIEQCLLQHPEVREAAVLARSDDGGSKRLVAYASLRAEVTVQELRSHLQAALPEYMIPAAFVMLDALPLTSNGKIDQRALPAPDATTLARNAYVAPVGELETALASIWSQVLDVPQVGRHDNFFELGGHSLLAVKLTERMRASGLHADVRTLFTAPTVANLAAALGPEDVHAPAPANLIPMRCERIEPAMLPLIAISQDDIDRIAAQVPGGAANIQDIYTLAPLQEGILFHHMLGGQGDAYLLAFLMAFDSRAGLDRYVDALQTVARRHDILRTAILWDGLHEPAQVVLREAPTPFEEAELDPAGGDGARQLYARFDPRTHRFDLTQAPLQRLCAAHDKPNGRWLLLMRMHHLVGDHATLEVMHEEIEACMLGREAALGEPQQFRDFVAHARIRADRDQQLAFFRRMLADVTEPTAPFGLLDVRGVNAGIVQAEVALAPELAARVRATVRRLGISPASLFHVAWAQVLAAISGRTDVVFGTVLFGRLASAGMARGLGLFINTLPIRVNLSGQQVLSSVRDTHALLAELMRHEHASLVDAQRCSGVPAPAPLFSSLFNYRHSAPVQPSANAADVWDGMEILAGEDRTNYPVQLSVDDLGDGFELSAQVDSSLDPLRLCQFMLCALEQLVRALDEEPQAEIARLDILPASERRRVLAEFNPPRTQYDADCCLHELVAAQASGTPDAVALTCDGRSMRYGELDRQANQLAHHLQAQGVGPDVLVGVFAERGIELVVGLLAILKAGGAYVPVDPGSPRERVEFILGDAAVQVLLTQRSLLDQLGESAAPRILLDEPQGWSRLPASAPACAATPSNLAYVIYTSGSTGKPKGVLIEHRNVTRLFAATDAWFGFNEQDVWSVFHSFAFDFSVWELWGPLLTGGRAVIVPYLASRSAPDFFELLRRERVTVLNQTPSAFLQLDQAEQADPHGTPLALRYVIFGGEALEPLTLKPWFGRHGDDGPQLVNMYGITETTVHVTWHRIDPAALDQGGSVIGRAIPDLSVYVLDGNGNPAPVGVAGELHVGGAGLARGYLNRPELTAARFIPDPFAGEPQARLYRSGDLARWLPDGTLEYLGRIDSQVKIRGFRIELGEIENALLRHEALRAAVVLAREDRPGDKRLVAYVTAYPGIDAAPAALREHLREHLRESLPEYMVPSAFVVLNALPLTDNGKVDRRTLPAPDYEGDQDAYVAPRTPLETALAAIVADILCIERAGMADSFFELGGHSLLATQLVSRMRRELDAELTLAQVFATPALGELARAIGAAASASADAIPAAKRGDALPASFAQERLWFLDQLAKAGEVANPGYVIPLTLRMHGELDVSCLHRALQQLGERHESLRTRLAADGDRIIQVIANSQQVELPLIDLSHVPPVEQEREVQLRAAHALEQRFDLAAAPLWRSVLLRLDARRHVLLVTMHHIVSDGWSMDVFTRELGALYRSALAGQAPMLASLPIQYADFAAWQRNPSHQQVLARQLEYWKGQLAGLPPLVTLPSDRPRPLRQTFNGASHALRLDRELATRIKALGQGEGATLFMTLAAAFAALVARHNNQSDIAFGTPIANRNRHEVEGLIGFFVNTLVLRCDLETAPDFASLLRQVKATSLAAYANQDTPFEQLVGAINPQRSLAHSPLFQLMFSLQNTGVAELELDGLAISEIVPSRVHAKFDLTLNMEERDEALHGAFVYNTDLFDGTTIARLARRFELLLRAVTTDPAQPLAAVPLLLEAERRQVLYDFNDTTAAFPDDLCLHQLFERQAEVSPDAPALLIGGDSLSYGELNQQANRLARHLQTLGAGPEVPVGLCVGRGIGMVVALLAVLKAGGAYVPVDPAHPPARIARMFANAGATLALTEQCLAGLLPADVSALCIDRDGAAWANLSGANLACPATPHNLAYIVYTSGSTGEPKGVETVHRGAVNYVSFIVGKYGVQAHDRVLQLPTVSFDASVRDIFGALSAGAALRIMSQDDARDPHAVAGWIERDRISAILSITPSFLDAVIQAAPHAQYALRLALVSGEVLPERLVAAAHSRFGAVLTIVNQYGPTECTMTTTFHFCVPGLPVRAGRPIANARVYVLDASMVAAPLGVAGDIYIGGVGLARGYRNQPQLTAERFVANPFAPGERLYRTGDLGRWNADGSLEYMGRIDAQLKIRGLRIEPGEIEAALLAQPRVAQALVMAREDVPGDPRLVAYLTTQDGRGLDETALRTGLRTSLPDYMVPAAFVVMDTLPLNTNGKVDRRALPPPEYGAAAREYVAPHSDTETALAQIVGTLLGIERVGMADGFFELGGHSLLATRVVSHVRQKFNAALPLSAVFEAGSIGELAGRIDRLLAETAEKTRQAEQAVRDQVMNMTEEQLQALLQKKRRQAASMKGTK